MKPIPKPLIALKPNEVEVLKSSSGNHQEHKHQLPAVFLVFVIFTWHVARVTLFDIQKAGVSGDVNRRNIDVTVYLSVSSHPNSLCDIQQKEMAFVTFTE